jgi:hypothetical protein
VTQENLDDGSSSRQTVPSSESHINMVTTTLTAFNTSPSSTPFGMSFALNSTSIQTSPHDPKGRGKGSNKSTNIVLFVDGPKTHVHKPGTCLETGLSLGSMVQMEIALRKKEALGMAPTQSPRKLGGGK